MYQSPTCNKHFYDSRRLFVMYIMITNIFCEKGFVSNIQQMRWSKRETFQLTSCGVPSSCARLRALQNSASKRNIHEHFNRNYAFFNFFLVFADNAFLIFCCELCAGVEEEMRECACMREFRVTVRTQFSATKTTCSEFSRFGRVRGQIPCYTNEHLTYFYPTLTQTFPLPPN